MSVGGLGLLVAVLCLSGCFEFTNATVKSNRQSRLNQTFFLVIIKSRILSVTGSMNEARFPPRGFVSNSFPLFKPSPILRFPANSIVGLVIAVKHWEEAG